MKLKYIFTALVAFAAVFSCKKEGLQEQSEIKVSTSYVSIQKQKDTTATLTLKAADAWTIALNDTTCKWLTISPTSGTAGETKLQFKATSTQDGRNTTATITCAGRTQIINIIQGTSEIATASCAEVLAGPDSKSYKVTGTCTAISNTYYGNFYINDGTGELYIYGTKDGTGSYNWEKFDIEVGDIVTVQGPKTTYNGTVELVDATFISVTKSLLKLDVKEFSLPKAAADTAIVVKYKGEGLEVIPTEDWISINNINVGADSTIVNINVTENTGDPRTGHIIFRSARGKQASESEFTIIQNGVAGTLAVPFTVGQAIDFCQNLAGTTPDQYYIKGTVSRVIYTFSAKYGTATFWISDDGEFKGTDDKNPDKTHDFECYSVYWLENDHWAEDQANISVGDEVLICGKMTNYNGVSETASKEAYIYHINGLTKPGMGAGSIDYPFSVAGAINALNDEHKFINLTKEYNVKGIATQTLYTFSAKYGTGTFWISDDGTDSVTEDKKNTNDKMHDFECYSVYWLGDQPWAEGCGQVAKGDIVVIRGLLTIYNGTSETSSKNAYIYSLNGESE